MDIQLFDRFAPVIRSLSESALSDLETLRTKLRIARDGDVDISYAPIDYSNPQAKIVIVGITPGATQFTNAVRECRNQLVAGADCTTAMRAAHRTAAFSGSMRARLVDLLNHVGVQQWLGVGSAEDLFGRSSELVQFTSLLRYPVFYRDKNYNGTPDMFKTIVLRDLLFQQFVEDARRRPDAVFLPLGDTAGRTLEILDERGLISRSRIVTGMPHPSTANNERIDFFLGQSKRAAPSIKTNLAQIERARAALIAKFTALKMEPLSGKQAR
jgi:hypothetical protein